MSSSADDRGGLKRRIMSAYTRPLLPQRWIDYVRSAIEPPPGSPPALYKPPRKTKLLAAVVVIAFLLLVVGLVWSGAWVLENTPIQFVILALVALILLDFVVGNCDEGNVDL